MFVFRTALRSTLIHFKLLKTTPDFHIFQSAPECGDREYPTYTECTETLYPDAIFTYGAALRFKKKV